MIQYLFALSLSSAMALNFGCFNNSLIELTSGNISRELLSSVDQQLCYNKSYYNFAVAFNYYYRNRTCEFLYNYSLTYRVLKNNASQMCILQLPDSQKTDQMSCSIRNSTWDPYGITVAGLENELFAPYAVIFSKNHSNMFVADTRHNQVLKYKADFSTFSMIYDSSNAGGNLRGPMAIALTNDGNELIVVSYSNKRVFRWSFITNRSSLVSFDYLAGATGVAVDQNDTVFVARSLKSSVWSYSKDTDPYWGHSGWSAYGFNGVKHITIVNQFIYMALSRICCVVKAPLTNSDEVTIVAGTCRIGSTADRLRFPWGVAVDPVEEHVFVSDSRNHRIQLWFANATEGITIAGINGRPGARSDQLNHPHGLTLGSDQSIFVADTQNNRIQKFQRYCII